MKNDHIHQYYFREKEKGKIMYSDCDLCDSKKGQWMNEYGECFCRKCAIFKIEQREMGAEQFK